MQAKTSEGRRSKETLDSLGCDAVSLANAVRQFSTLLRAGVPMIRSLEIVAQIPHPGLAQAFDEVALRVQLGSSISRAMLSMPGIFPDTFVSVIQIGESTGGLINCLELMVEWLENSAAIQGKVRNALIYPCFVLTLTVALTGAVIWFVLPSFMEMFRQTKVALPWPTQMLMLLSQALQSPLAWLFLAVSAYVCVELIRRRWRTPEGSCQLTTAVEQIPIVGWLSQCSGLARWSASLHTLVEAGVDLQSAVRLSGLASGNPLLLKDSQEALLSIRNGQNLSTHMDRRPQLYPSCLVRLLQTGEETGRIGSMMKQASRIYREEVLLQVDLLGAALEPILLSTVAFIVGFILVSIFLPMYSLVDKL